MEPILIKPSQENWLTVLPYRQIGRSFPNRPRIIRIFGGLQEKRNLPTFIGTAVNLV